MQCGIHALAILRSAVGPIGRQSSCNRIKLLVAFETLLWLLFRKLYIFHRDVDYIWHTMNKQILAHEGLNKRTERLYSILLYGKSLETKIKP